MRYSSRTLTTPFYSPSPSYTMFRSAALPLVDEQPLGSSRRFSIAIAPSQPQAWEDDDDEDDEDFVDDDDDVDVAEDDDDDFFDDDDEDLDDEEDSDDE